MASVSFFIGILGLNTLASNIISILVFTSPITTFRRVVKNKSTEDYKGIPYITTLLSTCLWTFYGLLKPGGLLVVTVNGAGAVLQFIYVTLFLIYAPKNTRIKSMKLVVLLNVGFLGAVIAITLSAIPRNTVRLTFVGFICALLTIGMYAAPLSSMRTVIQTKSVKFMPFFLSFFLFLNAGVWSVYSALVKDYYIGIPNVIGFALGSAQLILYFMYKNKSSQTKSKGEEPANLLESDIEMQGLELEENRNQVGLKKGRSLPKPLLSRKYEADKLLKTLSLTPPDYSLSHQICSEFGYMKEQIIPK